MHYVCRVLLNVCKKPSIIGRTLIDVEHRDVNASCTEDSEEVVLHFDNGYEISIYWNDGDIIVEDD